MIKLHTVHVEPLTQLVAFVSWQLNYEVLLGSVRLGLTTTYVKQN